MVETYFYTLISVFIVSLVSLVGIFTLSLGNNLLRRGIFVLVSLSAGSLLGGAIFHLIPEAFEGSTNTILVSTLILAGILMFFVLEKFFHWHHHHGEEHLHGHHKDTDGQSKEVIHPVGYMILVSDGLHNLLDGMIIAAGYMVSIEVGIAATVGIVLHEIPQEIGDFGVLLHSGFSRIQALFMNFLSALLAILGAVIVLIFGTVNEAVVLWAVPLAAGVFLYIAIADLIPELHKTTKVRSSIIQFAAMLFGVIAMFALLFLEI